MQRMNNANYSNQVIHGAYYPHIDGIRALAVLPVVLFHVLATLCPGGFAGVDVFFVISGYLITGGILRDLEQDRFTIRNFYHRRIRRIMPAYFALIAGVFVAGCTLYYATPLMLLGDAVATGTLFLANFYFLMMGGDYFAPQVHSQALLHLWSLSVEEQFYLFIPLLCAIVYKFSRRLLAPLLALLAILSLSGAIYAVMTDKQNSAFYLLHYRAWELLAGSLLAMLPAMVPKKAEPSKFQTHAELATASQSEARSGHRGETHALLATVGLLMVLIPYAVISSRTPFPGTAALPSVIGTVLLIRYGQSGWVSQILSWRPFVVIGKISYSLYLWHWPVTVFWKYAVYDQLYFYDYAGMFLLSLLLGYLSWKFVELPVRTSPSWTMRRSFAFATAGIAILVALGTSCVYYQGWPTILHPQANEWAGTPSPPKDSFLAKRMLRLVRRFCTITGHELSFYKNRAQKQKALSLAWDWGGDFSIGTSAPPTVFLIGDSHAGAFRYGLDTLLRKNHISGYAISCPNADMFNLKISESKEALKKLAESPQVSTVIIFEMWLLHYNNLNKYKDRESMYVKIEEFAIKIKSMGKKLFIATDVPGYPCNLNEIYAHMKIISPRHIDPEWESKQSEAKYNRMQGEIINNKLNEICKRTGAILIPLHLAFKEDNCYIYFEQKDNKTIPLYKDKNHLSLPGSLRAAQFVEPYLFSELTGEPQKDR